MSETTIEEAVLAFTEWRSQRKTKKKTPAHLKSMAVSLLANHSINEVCKRLSVNSSMLKCWSGLNKPSKRPSPTSDFVTIHPTENKVILNKNELVLSISTPNGIDCKLTGALEPNFIARLLQSLQGGNA